MLDRLSGLSGVLMTVLTFFKLVEGSNMELFLRWIKLGVILDVVYVSYGIIMSVLIVVFMFRWIKDWRILAVLGAIVFVFIQFVL